MSDSILDPTDDAIDETVERTPTILLLDTSGSMSEETTGPDQEKKANIERLNEGLDLFKEEVLSKEPARRRVDVALIEFGGNANARGDFTSIVDWTPPNLTAGGKTPMGEAIELAIDMSEQVKQSYDNNGITYTRPLFWLLTDGKPTDIDEGGDDWNDIQAKLRYGKEENHFELFAMGVEGADIETLNALVEPTGRPALQLKSGMFADYFQFLSNSLSDASQEDGTPENLGKESDLKEFIKMNQED